MRLPSTLLALYAASQSFAVPSQPGSLNPYPNKPRITFKRDGTFKLTVFSDLHYGENPWEAWGLEQDANSTRLMRRVLREEKPDFAVLSGDLITGENTFRENSTTLIDILTTPLNEARIPFCSIHGNHDNQPNITHAEEIQREQKVAPLSYTRTAPKGVGGTGGPGNYWVPVYRDQKASAPSLILWFFDSRGGFAPNDPTKRVDDWVDSSVATWIKQQTTIMDQTWGPALSNRGALAFVHIPPRVITDVAPTITPQKNPGLNEDGLNGSGTVQATAIASNEWKDMPWWNSLTSNVKNLHAVISGHDHGIEWCAREKTKDVIFCFAKHSGHGGYSSKGWEHGVRNIVFSSPDVKTNLKKGLNTWIRYEEGQVVAKVVLNAGYGR